MKDKPTDIQEKALQALADQAQELDMGYGKAPEGLEALAREMFIEQFTEEQIIKDEFWQTEIIPVMVLFATKVIADRMPFEGFWKRLLMFVENIEVSDCASEEEKEMIINISKKYITDKMTEK